MNAATASSDLPRRYPGPRPFSDNATEHRLFFGRDQEIETLAHRVRANRLLVVFGKSGLGKTSLLQAGLYPRLREYDLLPIPVRFDQSDADPLEIIIDATHAACEMHNVDAVHGARDSLWAFCSTTDLWQGDRLLTPVFVLDQFEEVFTLQEEGFRRKLALELRDLAGRGVPEAARKALAAEGESLSGDLTVQLVLSLREEYLGALEELVAEVPQILDARFRLTPLDEASARAAIVDPASLADGGGFRSAPFTYEAETVDLMLERLGNRRGEFEPFQLQVLCQHVEERVTARQQAGVSDVQVDRQLLPPGAMAGVLSNFYKDALAAVDDRGQRRRAARLCEQGLLNFNDKRVSLEEGGLLQQFRLRQGTLDVLVEKHLIRKDRRPGLDGFYYELSHDSLVEPIAKARPQRGRLLRNLAIAVPSLLLVGLALLTRDTLAEQYEVTTTRLVHWLGKAPALPELVEIPAGEFVMGSADGPEDERPPHRVSFAKPFYMSATELTFEQYEAFWATTGRDRPRDAGWGRENRPVIGVSWHDAQAYARWLSGLSGNQCRLPSEAEWEYAARAGTTSQYALPAPDGSDNIAGEGLANCDGCGSAWDGSSTAPVASFLPNRWGLHDMHGNVWEWVQDCYYASYEGAPDDGTAWLEENGENCSLRVLRGGSWYDDPVGARSAARYWVNPVNRDYFIGFRLVCSSPSLSTDR